MHRRAEVHGVSKGHPGVSNMDRLELFFSHLALTARVFLTGRLCGTSSDHANTKCGHLHVVRNGTIKIIDAGGVADVIDEPTILLYPYSEPHTFQSEGADIVCAFVEFGTSASNPLARALPKLLKVPLSAVPELQPVIELLFTEGFAEKPGRQIAVNRLMEYILVVLLRAGIERRLIQDGVLPAFSDQRLSKAIDAIHLEPERQWQLQELATVAGMSRARFAAHFLGVTGHTPFEYLAQWRISVAQSLLLKGDPLKLVAPYVGYASAGALTRAFTQRVGMSPTLWLENQRNAKA
jgi:AraC-like DNA-binding protein